LTINDDEMKADTFPCQRGCPKTSNMVMVVTYTFVKYHHVPTRGSIS